VPRDPKDFANFMVCHCGAAGTVLTPAGPRKLSFSSSVLGWSRYRSLSFCSERFGALAARLAASRPTRWLGLVSYGVFLWHIEAVHFAQMYLASGWIAAEDVDHLLVRDRRGRRSRRALVRMCGTHCTSVQRVAVT
jgi:hypothetical protein